MDLLVVEQAKGAIVRGDVAVTSIVGKDVSTRCFLYRGKPLHWLLAHGLASYVLSHFRQSMSGTSARPLRKIAGRRTSVVAREERTRANQVCLMKRRRLKGPVRLEELGPTRSTTLIVPIAVDAPRISPRSLRAS